ncbi:hypothetical protein FKM82_017051 [Ascaphus truei]
MYGEILFGYWLVPQKSQYFRFKGRCPACSSFHDAFSNAALCNQYSKLCPRLCAQGSLVSSYFCECFAAKCSFKPVQRDSCS